MMIAHMEKKSLSPSAMCLSKPIAHRENPLLLSSAKSTIVNAFPDYSQPGPSPSPARLSVLREGGISWRQARSERACVMTNVSLPNQCEECMHCSYVQPKLDNRHSLCSILVGMWQIRWNAQQRWNSRIDSYIGNRDRPASSSKQCQTHGFEYRT